jgi:hypothetical protein
LPLRRNVDHFEGNRLGERMQTRRQRFQEAVS